MSELRHFTAGVLRVARGMLRRSTPSRDTRFEAQTAPGAPKGLPKPPLRNLSCLGDLGAGTPAWDIQHDDDAPQSGRGRRAVGALAVGMALLALLAACMAAPGGGSDEEAQDQRATVVVQFDDVAALVRPVSFSDPISGLAALERTGLDVVTADMGWGTAVCSIEGVGCTADDCFCAGDQYWGYAYWDGDAWQGYSVGASQSVISATGQVEGWRWGAGEPALIPAERADAALRALTWLHARQENDGGYGGMGATVETLLALAANGEDASTWRSSAAADGPSLLDYALANAAEYSRIEVAAAGKLALALSGVGACWPADALTPADYYSPTLAALGADAGPLALGILGSLALAQPVDDANGTRLAELALAEGGWEWAPGWGRDTNTTSLAIQALVALGMPATVPAIQGGLAFLAATQTAEGGLAYDDKVGEADANSTAFVVQALLAVGEDPAHWATTDRNLWRYLLAAQSEDGALRWQAGEPAPNVLATQQAVAAFLGRTWPLQTAALPACPPSR